MESLTSLMSRIPTIKKDKLSDTNLFSNYVEKHIFNSETYTDVIYTLDYIFRRYGKAIYVKIIDNKIENFIPFKNQDYKNSWQKKYVNEFSEGTIELEKNIIGLLDGYVVLDYNNDNDIYWIEEMLTDLCANRNIPDCEFFINSEKNIPLISTNHKTSDLGVDKNLNLDFFINHRQHVVFSFNTSEKFKDLGFPVFVDFKRIQENIFGIRDFKSMKWEDKTTEFLLRTNSTNNEGVFINKEPMNKKMALIDILNKKQKYKEFLNLSISVIDKNPIIYKNHVYEIKVPEYMTSNEDLSEPVSKSKFIFVIDSIGSCQDFSDLMFTGSCILKVNSKWSCWFEKYMIPDVHYKIISEDLSDLEEIVEWCLNNDSECKSIGLNSREFAIKYLSKNGIYDYLENTFTYLNQVKYKTKFNIIQAEFQKNFLKEYFYNDFPLSDDLDLSHIMNKKRFSYSENKAISMLCSKGIIFYELIHIKTYTDFVKGINHAFIGLKEINKLSKEIPNFCYTYFCKSEENNFLVFSELIKNCFTLDQFLKSNPQKEFEVFIQIFLSLQMAYERFCFHHENLDPKHILIQTLDKPKKIIYRLMDKTLAIDTKHVVVITNFHKSIILSNFNCYDNKNPIMFIGNINIDDNNNNIYEKMLHSQGNSNNGKNLKYLIKKSSRKLYKNFLEDSTEPKTPIDIMKRTISKDSIKSEKIKFGNYEETEKDLKPENPRLIYDKITKVENPHEKIYDRVFENSLPNGSSVFENIILQYEILQSIKSGIIDLNIKFNVDILTSERLKKCFEFVKNYYNGIINEILNDETIAKFKTEELYSIKCVLQKYLFYIISNFSNEKLRKLLSSIIKTTLKDAIIFGVKNTIKFYEKFN